MGSLGSNAPHLPAFSDGPDFDSSANIIPFSTPEPTSLGTTFISSLSVDTSSSRPSANLCLPSYVASISNVAYDHPSDDTPEYYACCDDPFADDSISDPSLDPTACTQPLPSLLATPILPFQQTHFDSPTEDLSDSDHLQSGYEIDCIPSDFHWVPFNRKDSTVTDRKETMSPIPLQQAGFEVYVDTEPDRQGLFQATKQSRSHFLPSLKRMRSPSPFAFTVGSQGGTYTIPSTHKISAQQEHQITPESQRLRHMLPVFAPAPGIFLSPLRDPVLPNFQDVFFCEPMTLDHVRVLSSSLDQFYNPDQLSRSRAFWIPWTDYMRSPRSCS